MTNIPRDTIIQKCNESKYKIHETIVRLRGKLNSLNVLATGFFNQSNSYEFQKFESMTETVLPVNSNWKELNRSKEIKNYYDATPSINSNCVVEITLQK